MSNQMKVSEESRSWYGNCQVCTAGESMANVSEKVMVVDVGMMSIRLCKRHQVDLMNKLKEAL